MKKFILRVMRKLDCQLVDEGGLMGIIPWFSGTTATQNIEALEDALLNAAVMDSSDPWLSYRNTGGVTAGTAELGVIGYVQVAAMKSDSEMKKFVRRVCTEMGVKVVDEGGFEGMVKFYSGTDNFQSFERLQTEIKSAANAPHTWARWMPSATAKDKK